MNILLDTNVCIAVMNGRPAVVRERFRRAVDSGDTAVIASITVFELWYGVAKSARVAFNTERLAAFLSAVEILSFDEDDARIAGTIRDDLRRTGMPIGGYDLLIASQALHHDLLLVTANVGEFSRVRALRWEDWSV